MRMLKRIDLAGFVLEPFERALVRSEISGGSALATNEALHITDIDRQSYERIEWWQVKQVSFDPGEKTLKVSTEVGQVELEITASSLLPETVRERVTATILMSVTLAPPNEARAVISLRRRPVANADQIFIEVDWVGLPSERARARAEQQGRWLKEQILL